MKTENERRSNTATDENQPDRSQTSGNGNDRRQGGSSALAESRSRGLERPWYGRGGITDPFSAMRQVSQDMDRWFFDWMGIPMSQRRAMPSWTSEMWAPQIDVREDDKEMVLSVDLPGIEKKDVKVEIDEGTLIIHGERKEEREVGPKERRRSECCYGSFYRAISLPEGSKPENAKARMKDGVLEIVVPVEHVRKSRHLEIQQ